MFSRHLLLLLCLIALVIPRPGMAQENMLDALSDPMFDESAEELIDNPLRVTGELRGPVGPAEGVFVRLEIRDMRSRMVVSTMETRSDTTGFFQFDLSRYEFPRYGLEMITSSRRYADYLQIEVVPRVEMPYHFRVDLRPGVLLRGKVIDQEGNPLDDVLVGGPMINDQRSDSRGEWEVYGLQPGAWRVRFQKEGYAETFLEGQYFDPGIYEDLDVVMDSARNLEGAVRDWAGRLVPGARAYLQSTGRFQESATDAEGRFRFEALPEALTDLVVVVRAPQYLMWQSPITEEMIEEGINVTLVRGARLEGTVTLPSGSPAASVPVVLLNDFGVVLHRLSTDNTGHWSSPPLLPGSTVRMAALPPRSEGSWGVADVLLNAVPGSEGASYTGDIPLWPGGFSSDVEATINGRRFRMTRVDNGSGGVSGEVVYDGTLSEDGRSVEGTVHVAAIEQEGTFTLRRRATFPGGPMAGEWEVRERFDPSRLAVAPVMQSLRIPSLSATLSRDLQLEPGRTIRGRVLREDGAPFIDGTVTLSDWQDSTIYNQTAEIGIGGRFEMTRVPPGSFLLSAASRDGARRVEPMFALGDQEEIILREGGTTSAEPMMDD